MSGKVCKGGAIVLKESLLLKGYRKTTPVGYFLIIACAIHKQIISHVEKLHQLPGRKKWRFSTILYFWHG